MPLADPTAPPSDASTCLPAARIARSSRPDWCCSASPGSCSACSGTIRGSPTMRPASASPTTCSSNGDWVMPQLAGAPAPVRPPLFYALAAASAAALRAIARIARRRARGDRTLPRIDPVAARAHRTRALRRRLSLAAGAHFHRLHRTVGSRPCARAGHRLAGCVRAGPLRAGAGAAACADLGGLLLGASAGVAFLCRGPPWRGDDRADRVPAGRCSRRGARAVTRDARTRRARGRAAAGRVAAGAVLARSGDCSRNGRSDKAWRASSASPPARRRSSRSTICKNLPWFAWPALPLALWTLWLRARGYNGGLAQPGIVLPVTMMHRPAGRHVGRGGAPRDAGAAAAAAALPARRGGGRHAQARVLGRARLVRHPDLRPARGPRLGAVARIAAARLARADRANVSDTQPGYQPPWQWLALARVRDSLRLLWIALVRPARRSNRRAVLNWAAGMTLVWGLYTTIWLPYLDSRRSYRPVAESLAQHLPAGTSVWRAAISANRSARCSSTSRDRAGARRSRRGECVSAAAAAGRPRRSRMRRRIRRGKKSGKATAAATTPSVSCSFGGRPATAS